MAKCAYGIVIARTPMILHRQTRKLVVFGVTFVISSPIDQVHDVVDLVTGDRLQDLQIIVLLKIAREPAEKSRKSTLHTVHALELFGARARAARKLNFLVTCGDFGQVARKRTLRVPEVNLKCERVLATGVALDYPLQRRIGYKAAIPVLLAIDFDGRKAGRQWPRSP